MSESLPLERLREQQKIIHDSYGFWGAGDLNASIERAIEVEEPGGKKEHAREIAEDYSSACRQITTAMKEVDEVRRLLPQCWVGETHISAMAALGAISDNLNRALEATFYVSKEIEVLADVIESTNNNDGSGVTVLRQAGVSAESITAGVFPDPSSYDGAVMKKAHEDAMWGIDRRVMAHSQMRDGAREASRCLYDIASQARLERLIDSPLPALDEVVIANAGIGSGGSNGAILSAAGADRAAEAMNGLDRQDREALNKMLAGAGSPEQRAYLLKALAAGYSVADVARLNQMIASHGSDPDWLRKHLSPLDTTGADPAGQQTPTTFEGAGWSQGNHPTCVASSTVTARAQVDPIYALELTSGGHPGDPAYDNPQAFAERLRDEQERVYEDGRAWYQDLMGSDGMTREQSEAAANEEVSPHTGIRYDNREMDNPGDRQAVLGDIERAVDEGYPVPFSVTGDGGHQMLVVGHEGGMLQIYNPWGYTVWVTEDDFVNGNMGRAGTGVPDTPAAVRLPRMDG